ncbi:hypothetical protein I2486_19105 [Cellulophaga sp. E16_2]|uniref:hypothetical protein n=1 Tax=Cellulophaga sp. E16_2 TaxID=2789297 RepID=UPI001A939F6F|nr:hypothetical protein [Cellulophaga sp. E16_2]MBO0593513.1 hypothetical protein [Cellulophaga sp. E16_2]
MKDKKYILILLVGAFSMFQNSFSQDIQKRDTLYFDGNWKETTRLNHEFYRLLPLKVTGNLSLIKDFYKNGNMQMQGYAYTDSPTKFTGDVYYYNEDGSDHSFEQYYNPTNIPLAYYHNNGSVWKKITYKDGVKDGKVENFNNKNVLTHSKVYEDGFILNNKIGSFYTNYYSGNNDRGQKYAPNLKDYTKSTYWLNTSELAKKITYINDEIVNETTYYESGKLLQNLNKADFFNNELIEGKYYNLKTNNGFVVALDTINFDIQKSKQIKLSNISHVETHDNGKLNFYQKGKLNDFIKLNYKFHYNHKTHERSFTIIGTGEKENDLENIKKNVAEIIKVSDIKTQSIESLLKEVENKEWLDNYPNNEKRKAILNQFNPDFLTSFELIYSNARDNRSRVIPYPKEDDEIEKWRLNELKLYKINIVMLNETKPILILSNGNYIEGHIIPTKNKGLLIKLYEKNYKEQTNSSVTESILKELMLNVYSPHLYDIKDKNKKKYICNYFNDILIDKGYDSIQKYTEYLIGNNKENIDIYNSKLYKLPINNIRKYYYDRSNLQILSNNTIKYIDVLGKETKRNNEIILPVCGNEPGEELYESYEIMTSNKKHFNNTIKRTSTHNPLFLFSFENLDNSYDLTFLNKKKYIGNYDNNQYLLVVTKNKKVGLFSYQIPFTGDTINKKSNTIEEAKNVSTVAKQLLSVDYDGIELRGALIIVKKDKRYGIFPLKDKGLIYKKLGEIEVNFMSYEKLDGEKGWIDVNTYKEYPNEN